MHLKLALVLATASTLVLISGSSAVAAPRGPAFGNNRYRTEIRTARELPDVDDYVAPLLAGERLTVVVVADRKSDLRPTLTLIGPDGSPIAVAVKSRKKGRMVFIKDLEVTGTGEWTARVSGDEGTEGLYTIRFKVKSAPPVRFKKQRLGGGAGTERSHEFAGLDGALVDLTLRFRARDAAVRLRSLQDPSGDEVPGDAGPAFAEAVTKKTRTTLSGATLATGHGAYRATVGIDDGAAHYSLNVKVTPTGRPKGRRVVFLAVEEPFLNARAEPLRGVAAQPIQVTGGNFSLEPAPTVLFDGVPGTSVVVAQGGASLEVVPPAGVAGETVELAVKNADGQAAVQPDYFLYAAPPEITALLRADGSTAIGGDTRGGQTFRVVGNFLHTEQSVFFGTKLAGRSLEVRPGELIVLTPPSGVALVPVKVTDPYGRSSTSSFLFEFKAAPRFDAAPYDPPFAGVASGTSVLVSGTGLLDSDVVLFDGEEIAVELLSASQFRIELPPLALGEYELRIRDRVGSEVVAPVFTAKNAPSIADVVPAVAPFAGVDEAPLNGGAVFEVTGASFHALDSVSLTDAGGEVTEVQVTTRTFSAFRFVTPEGAPGLLDLTIRDAAGQSITRVGAVRRVGYLPATASRVPTPGAVDDFSAWRGAIGDLDRDGDEDDVVLVSYNYFRNNVYRGGRSGTPGVANDPGTRQEFTRVLIGDDDGVLADQTASRIPAAGSDPDGTDDWNAMAVAIGDLDGANGPDIVIGGVSPEYTVYNDVRLFRNDGTGSFVLETDDPLPHGYLEPAYAYDENGQSHVVFTARYNQGLPTAIAIGDIDSDGDDDIVVGREFYDATYAYLDPTYVDFTQTPPYVTASDASTYFAYRFYYYPATKIFRNALSTGGGWVDRTADDLPSAGDSTSVIAPALHARDIALGDLDGDNDLDLVVAWDDPLTVSAYGLYGRGDQARVATRVLLNDGSGAFTDRTSTWLPGGSAPEFWQGDRLALADLDGDLDLDLVLLLEQSVDAYQGTPTYGRSALRILRNDGATVGFTDVTSAALPALSSSSNDNWRGGALAVRDVDGDGILDVLVATRERLQNGVGTAIRSTRLLLGVSGLRFRRADAFLAGVSVDTGEADDLLLGDLAGTGRPTLLRLGEKTPRTSDGGANLRDSDWRR